MGVKQLPNESLEKALKGRSFSFCCDCAAPSAQAWCSFLGGGVDTALLSELWEGQADDVVECHLELCMPQRKKYSFRGRGRGHKPVCHSLATPLAAALLLEQCSCHVKLARYFSHTLTTNKKENAPEHVQKQETMQIVLHSRF